MIDPSLEGFVLVGGMGILPDTAKGKIWEKEQTTRAKGTAYAKAKVLKGMRGKPCKVQFCLSTGW